MHVESNIIKIHADTVGRLGVHTVLVWYLCLKQISNSKCGHGAAVHASKLESEYNLFYLHLSV